MIGRPFHQGGPLSGGCALLIVSSPTRTLLLQVEFAHFLWFSYYTVCILMQRARMLPLLLPWMLGISSPESAQSQTADEVISKGNTSPERSGNAEWHFKEHEKWRRTCNQTNGFSLSTVHPTSSIFTRRIDFHHTFSFSTTGYLCPLKYAGRLIIIMLSLCLTTLWSYIDMKTSLNMHYIGIIVVWKCSDLCQYECLSWCVLSYSISPVQSCKLSPYMCF